MASQQAVRRRHRSELYGLAWLVADRLVARQRLDRCSIAKL